RCSLSRPPVAPAFPYTTLFRSYPAHPRPGGGLHTLALAHPGVRRTQHRNDSIDPGTAPRSREIEPNLTDATAAGSKGGATTSSRDRKSTRLNSSHVKISYAVFC